MNNIWKSHLALFSANFLYGLNYVIVKGIIPEYITPEALVFLRIIPTTILFWFAGIFVNQKISDSKDYWNILFSGFFGVFINNYLFIKGLNYSSPIDASIIMTTNPILVMIVAAIVLSERMSAIKIGGIIIGIVGALMLIAGKGFMGFKGQYLSGDLMLLANSVSFAVYFAFARPLMRKYDAVVVLKWIFLVGAIFYFPVGFGKLFSTHWNVMPGKIIFSISYVVVFTTFLTYFLINYSLKYLKSTTVSIYIYIQPIVAAIVAIITGMDRISILNISASLLVFLGVYLVSIVNHKKMEIKSP